MTTNRMSSVMCANMASSEEELRAEVRRLTCENEALRDRFTSSLALCLYAERLKAENESLRNKPNTLMVCRPVINGRDIVQWALSVGITNVRAADKLHATIAVSYRPVDWNSITPPRIDTPLVYRQSMWPYCCLRYIGSMLVLWFSDDTSHRRRASISRVGGCIPPPICMKSICDHLHETAINYWSHIVLCEKTRDEDSPSYGTGEFRGTIELGAEEWIEYDYRYSNKPAVLLNRW